MAIPFIAKRKKYFFFPRILKAGSCRFFVQWKHSYSWSTCLWITTKGVGGDGERKDVKALRYNRMNFLRKIPSLILKFFFQVNFISMGIFFSPVFLWSLGWENMKKHISSPNSLKAPWSFLSQWWPPLLHEACVPFQWKNFKMMLAIVSNTVLVREVLLTFSAEVGRMN